jgi:hypothetical protein
MKTTLPSRIVNATKKAYCHIVSRVVISESGIPVDGRR